MAGQSDDPDDNLDQPEIDIFQEPNDYYQPKKPFTFTEFEMKDGRIIPLRLVGESPLWAHHLWNGAKTLADHLQQNAETLVKGRAVLELGAAAGLPSLVSAVLGADYVFVTDYPDPELIENLQYNIAHCSISQKHSESGALRNITAAGYLWGSDVKTLLEALPCDGFDSSCEGHSNASRRFETLLMADILYNHSEHRKLVHTIRHTLARTADAQALVFFTPYRPWLLNRDMAFFDLLNRNTSSSEYDGKQSISSEGESEVDSEILGFEQIFKTVLPKAMFEDDPGDETLRRTVFGYEIFWSDLRP